MNPPKYFAAFLDGYEKLSRFAISISLGAAGICCASSYLLFGSVGYLCFVLPFVATLLVYNLDRLAEPSEADLLSNPERTAFVKKHRKIYVALLLLSFLLMTFFSLSQGWIVFWTVLSFPLSAVLYVLPILPFKKIRRLKEIPAFKTAYVSLCWCILIVLVIVLQQKAPNPAWTVFLCLFIYLRLFVGVFLGDLRDIKGDEATNVRTMALMMGEKKSLLFLDCLHVLSVLLIPFFIVFYQLPLYVSGLGLSALIGYYFHLRIKEDRYKAGVYFDLFDLEYHSYPFVLWAMQQVLSL